MKKKLIFFTAQYPYGNKSETFIETEIHYLSEGYEQIIIYPTQKDNFTRQIPKNVEIDDLLTLLDLCKANKLIVLLKNILIVLEILKDELLRLKYFLFLKNIKLILDALSIQLLKYEALNSKISNCEKTVLYDYWSLNSTLALAILKKKKSKLNFIARAHGYDLYDERNPNVGILFRDFIIKYIDTQFLISDIGLEYQKSKIVPKFHQKLIVSKLGVETPPNIPLNRNERYTIVSCSSILEFKGVHKIPNVLNLINDIPIRWIHFGDGENINKVLNSIENLNDNVSVKLMGHIENEKVLNFYQHNYVDLFISLSTSEGLPVSMMEAQSYGIPIMAYEIDGIPEIVVRNKTGYLLKLNEPYIDIAQKIRNELLYPMDKSIILEYWNQNFNAKQNYQKFIKTNTKLCVV